MTTPTGPSPASSANDAIVKGFVAQAETMFGPRTNPATFKVEEIAGNLHADWEPITNHVTIRIPPGLNSTDRNGQLAHEAFHVYSPATLAEASVFDEGLATFFSNRKTVYLPMGGGAYWNYFSAYAVVEGFNHSFPTAISQLLTLRKRIALVSEADILTACSNKFPKYAAQYLTQKFYK